MPPKLFRLLVVISLVLAALGTWLAEESKLSRNTEVVSRGGSLSGQLTSLLVAVTLAALALTRVREQQAGRIRRLGVMCVWLTSLGLISLVANVLGVRWNWSAALSLGLGGSLVIGTFITIIGALVTAGSGRSGDGED